MSTPPLSESFEILFSDCAPTSDSLSLSPLRVPPVQDFTYGKLVLTKSSADGGSPPFCLDSGQGYYNSIVEIRPCEFDRSGPDDGGQGWVKLTSGGFKHSSLCLALSLNQFRLQPCTKTDTTQSFTLLSNGLLHHKASRKCVAPAGSAPSLYPVLEDCDLSNPSPNMLWQFRT